MMHNMVPGLVLILGAFLVPLFRGRSKSIYLLVLPLLSFIHLMLLPYGEYGQLSLFDYTLTTIRIDKLSTVFGIVFHIAVFLSVLCMSRITPSKSLDSFIQVVRLRLCLPPI